MNAGAGLKVLAITIINQRVQTIDAFGNDIAAAPAIAAVRAAKFDILLAPKRNAAGTAIAGANIDFCLVEKFHLLNPYLAKLTAFARKAKATKKER